MPYYSYRDPATGRILQQFYSYVQVKDGVPKTVEFEGVTFERDIKADGVKPAHGTSTWPKRSRALGVGVQQIPEAYEEARRLGVNVEYDRTNGDAIVGSEKDQAILCRSLGMKNFDEGFTNCTG